MTTLALSVEPVEARVRQIVAKHSGVDANTISLTDTIDHSLGLAGEDVSELFEELVSVFSIDLSALEGQWQTYFLPEVGEFSLPGMILGGGLLAIPVAGLVWLFHHLGWTWVPDWLVIGGAVVASLYAWGTWTLQRQQKLPPERPQISVGDLVNAARTGKLILRS